MWSDSWWGLALWVGGPTPTWTGRRARATPTTTSPSVPATQMWKSTVLLKTIRYTKWHKPSPPTHHQYNIICHQNNHLLFVILQNSKSVVCYFTVQNIRTDIVMDVGRSINPATYMRGVVFKLLQKSPKWCTFHPLTIIGGGRFCPGNRTLHHWRAEVLPRRGSADAWALPVQGSIHLHPSVGQCREPPCHLHVQGTSE